MKEENNVVSMFPLASWGLETGDEKAEAAIFEATIACDNAEKAWSEAENSKKLAQSASRLARKKVDYASEVVDDVLEAKASREDRSRKESRP